MWFEISFVQEDKANCLEGYVRLFYIYLVGCMNLKSYSRKKYHMVLNFMIFEEVRNYQYYVHAQNSQFICQHCKEEEKCVGEKSPPM